MGSNARLGMIILNGLEGPIHINGKLYSFNGAMPRFRDIFSDEEIEGIMDYLHNSFAPADPKLSYGRLPVKPEEINPHCSKNVYFQQISGNLGGFKL